MSEEKKEERFIKISVVKRDDGMQGIHIQREGIGYLEELGLYKHATNVTLMTQLSSGVHRHHDEESDETKH